MGTEIEVPFHIPYFYAVQNYSDERNVFHKLNIYNVHFQQSCLNKILAVTEFQVHSEKKRKEKKGKKKKRNKCEIQALYIEKFYCSFRQS